MSDLKNWADNAELNTASAPNGWPEGMPPSAVNNSAREMMAALRRAYVRQPWYAPGGTIVRTSTSQITIADDAKVTNYSDYYTVGARVRVEYSGGYITGFVSNSVYEAPTSTISFTLDAEAELPATITDIYVGLSPEDIQGVAGPNLLGCIVGFTEEGTKVGAGLLLANGEKFNPSLYPDLANLYYMGDDESNLPVYRYGRELVGDVYWPLRPDVRGYYPRFADDRVAPGEDEEDTRIDPDAPRTVGSTQGDLTAEHYHTLIANKSTSTRPLSEERPYVALKSNEGLGNYEYWLCATDVEPTLGKSTVVGGEETRSKNIAVVGVIVAYSGVTSAGLADVTELETFCTAERVRAEEFADAAGISAGNASNSALAAATSESLAQQWATKTDGLVAETDYSAKHYASQASTSASNASSSADLAHAWATSTTVVEEGNYGAKYYAADAAGSATSSSASATAAQQWATKMDGPVSGSDYSSKHYSTQAGNSATQAAASASEAADIVATIGTVMRYKGSVATYADLPSTGNTVGDVYNVTATGNNYAWTTENTWDDFGGAVTASLAACTDVDLSSPTNGQVLSYNATTQKWENSSVAIPTVDQTYDSTSANAQSGVAIDGAGFLKNTSTTNYNLGIWGTTNNSGGRSGQVSIGPGANTNYYYCIAIGSEASATSSQEGIAIGRKANVNGGGIAIGGKTGNGIAIGTGTTTTSTGSHAVAIGSNATGSYAVALGNSTSASGAYATSLGSMAKTSADYAIQLGYGTNSTANTFSVGLSSSLNVQLLDSTGTIPFARQAQAIIEGASDPTTATTGTVGLLYRNTTDGGIFKCTDTTGSVYTWEELGAGGSSASDANTLRSLTSTQATQLLANGTYNGEIVEDGEVFTNTSGKFQMFGDAQAISGSSVGVTNPTSSYGRSIAWDGNNTIVYVEQATGKFGYTTDGGSTWSSGDMPTTTDPKWRTIVYSNGKFVAVGNGACAYSTDGYTWNLGTGISSTTELYNACYDEVLGLYVGVGKSNASNPTEGIAVTSSDGINWEEYILSGDTIFSVVVSSGGAIIVPGQNGKSYWSANGETWNLETTSNLTSDHSTAIWNGYEYVMVEKTTSKTITSTDGITWTKTSNDLPSGDYITLSYGQEGRYEYYLVEKAGTASSSNTYVSLDALHWVKVTTNPSSWFGCSAVFNTKDNKFYACGTSKLQVITPTVTHTYSLTDKSMTKTEIDDAKYLKNSSTASNALTLIGTATTQANSVNIGYSSQASSGGYSVAIGSSAITRGNGVSVGKEAQQSSGCSFGVALGSESKVGAFVCGSALGAKASVQAHGSIQIGQGTNSEAQTLYVGFSNSSGTATNNYKMLDSSGIIPAARLGTLPAADGTYIPVLTITSGVPTISWVAYTP